MRINLVRVKNFRSIVDVTIPFDVLTALVGPNGAGKSAILSAISLFYTISPRVSLEDFYNRDCSSPIEVEITFVELDPDEKQRFANYIQNEALVVTRVLTLTENKYHGSALQNPDFAEAKNANSAGDLKERYKQLIAGKYATQLSTYTNQDAARSALKEWEAQHPGDCSRERDDGQFFGFKQVGQGYLGKDTKFIYIPAVRDAATDATDGRGSVVSELVDLAVRRTLFEKEEIRAFKEEIETRYKGLIDPDNFGQLKMLSENLSRTLGTYVGEATVSVTWGTPAPITVPIPNANISITEDGFESEIGHTGHGLQRAFILTTLQHLAAPGPSPDPASADSVETSRLPDLILGIEEPEMYQHPSRQRHFANVLLQLATGSIPGVAKRTQVIYTTHSPLMVGLDRFDQIRLIRKVPKAAGLPKQTVVTRKTLADVAAAISKVQGKGKVFTSETLRSRLTTLITPWMAEGFFSKAVVLVEGESDRAAIQAVAATKGQDLDALGISLIPCLGKTNVFTAAAIFVAFEIPVYAIWDGDAHLGPPAVRCSACGHDPEGGANPIENQLLLRLFGLQDVEWPRHVCDTSACFESKLEATLEAEIGKELFEKALQEQRQQFSISRKRDAIKNPAVLEAVLASAAKAGKESETLVAIVNAIVGLITNK